MPAQTENTRVSNETSVCDLEIIKIRATFKLHTNKIDLIRLKVIYKLSLSKIVRLIIIIAFYIKCIEKVILK